jgi:hypothetical protein
MGAPSVKQLATRIRPYVHFYASGVRIDVHAWLRAARAARFPVAAQRPPSKSTQETNHVLP